MVIPEKLLHNNPDIPLYKQFEQMIHEQIIAGELREGETLQPERELQEQYGISRATIRHALDELERAGWVRRIQGFGTIISKPKIRPVMMQLTSFTEDIQARGLIPESKTIDLILDEPDAEVAQALQLQEGEKVWCAKRLRSANQEPVGIHQLYIPPNLEFAVRDLMQMSSYYQLLEEKLDLEPAYATEIFTAKNANEEESQLLETSLGSALLVIKRTSYAPDETPIEYVYLVYRADRYEYQVDLLRK